MAWAEIILYITKPDAERIREWINAEAQVAWIIETARSGTSYSWKAIDQLPAIRPQQYSIWHKEAGRLTIPSGRLTVPDVEVLDPYGGWTQTLEGPVKTCPWFGANLPGPYTFIFKEAGVKNPEALGRSGFSWAGDHYRVIGKPAHPEAKRWWQRLKRFVRSNSTPVPWPYPTGLGKMRAYAFANAFAEIQDGRAVDANP